MAGLTRTTGQALVCRQGDHANPKPEDRRSTSSTKSIGELGKSGASDLELLLVGAGPDGPAGLPAFPFDSRVIESVLLLGEHTALQVEVGRSL